MEHNQQSGERSQQTLGVSSKQSEQTTKGCLPFPSENTTPKVEPMVPLNEREYFLHSTGAPSALQKLEVLGCKHRARDSWRDIESKSP